METKTNATRVIKDSGQKREFGTGSHRDMAVGKGRCDLLPAESVLIIMETEGISTGDYCTHLKKSLTAAMKYLKGEEQKNLYIAAREAVLAVGINEGFNEIDIKNTDACLMYGFMKTSVHYEEGAAKYGENNWKLGQPTHVLLDSAMRHTMKAIAEIDDENHIRAAAWNLLCLIWTDMNLPEMRDIPSRK